VLSVWCLVIDVIRKPEIRTYPNLEDLSRAAAWYVCETAGEAIKKNGVFTFVLSGGSTPRLLYEELARQPISKRIDWQKTHIFWGDERYLPPDHNDSNYALAFQRLLSKVDVPPANVHRIITENSSAKDAADNYEKTLRQFFLPPSGSEDDTYLPSFDVVLLGLGEDGHTASLFPGDAALEEKYRWVVAVDGANASPPVQRITLTIPILNMADCAIFLVSGSRKKEVFEEIMNNPGTAPYPAARIRPSGRLLWFIDKWLV
jgi:6-phosphogluconolactonase